MTNNTPNHKFFGRRAAIVILTACVGCNDKNLPTTVPVAGTVSFDGGECPAQGMVRFVPLEVADGHPRRPGRAKFDRDGRFEVSSFPDRAGLVPGKYRVLLECWKIAPVDGRPGTTYVAEFQPTEVAVSTEDSHLTVDIAAVQRSID
jgi:hypothetical protein